MNEEIAVYLAAPYTVRDDTISEAERTQQRDQRVEAINSVAATLMKEGLIVFSPITHSHPLALAHDMPGTWDFWERQDMYWLERCDKLVVLQLPGWEESQGVQAEIAHATALQKDILYVDVEDSDAQEAHA